ncbi:MAG TPA: hypothetical protein V6D23_24685 [Candidatus Obscuribacterales bacterium]
MTGSKIQKYLLSSLCLIALLQGQAPAADSPKTPGKLVEINVGSLLGDVSQYKESFAMVYSALKDLAKDPDKVSSFTAELPHTVHVGDELEFIVANVDDEATFVFEGVTQTLFIDQPAWHKRIKVRKEGENLILFSISQGMINPNAWHGDLMVKNLTSGEELIDHHPAGNDGLMPGRKRVYLFKFNARRQWYDLFH